MAFQKIISNARSFYSSGGLFEGTRRCPFTLQPLRLSFDLPERNSFTLQKDGRTFLGLMLVGLGKLALHSKCRFL